MAGGGGIGEEAAVGVVPGGGVAGEVEAGEEVRVTISKLMPCR